MVTTGNASLMAKVLIVGFICIVVLTFELMVLSLPIGLYALFFTNVAGNGPGVDAVVRGIVLDVFGFFPVVIPIAVSLGTIFVALWLIYALMLGIATLGSVDLFSAVRSSLETRGESILRSPMLATIVLLGATLLATLVIDAVQTSAGVGSGGISGQSIPFFVSVTLAPLREEIGFRLTIVGLIAFVYGARSSLKTAVKALWRPSIVYESVSVVSPGRLSFERVLAGASIVFSAILFGLAHFVSHIGWQVGRITTAGVAGLALGYLYYKYGLHAAILLHWGVNYFPNAYALLGQGLYGVPWQSDPGTFLTQFVATEIVYVLGVPSLIFVAYKFLKRGKKSNSGVIPYDSSGTVNSESAR
jgi:hypothetical protein